MEVVRVVVLEIHVKCARIVDLLARLISRLILRALAFEYWDAGCVKSGFD